MTVMASGECACGSTVWREQATGLGADLINRLPFQCPDCLAGMEAEEQATARRRAEVVRGDEAAKRMLAQLPAGLRAVDLDALDPRGCREAIVAARRWAERGGGLMLAGAFGVGKTTVAAGAMRLRLERTPGFWLSAPLLMARLGSGFDSPQRRQVQTALLSTAALVLDDLDKTRPTEYGAEQIFLAVDGAVSNERPLLVTTNLDMAELAMKWPEPFGEAIASRLAGYCRVVAMTGPDRRLASGGQATTDGA